MLGVRWAGRLLTAFPSLVWALRLATALAALVLILLPAELWSQPSLDLRSEGFDQETVYVDKRGNRYVSDPFLVLDGREIGRQSIPVAGSPSAAAPEVGQVTIEPAQLRLVAPPAAGPSVHLLTTPLSFRAAFDVTIEEAGDGQPFQAMLWNPRTFGAVSVVFGPAPQRRIEAVVSENRGQVTARTDLGHYERRQPYQVQVKLDRGARAELHVAPAHAPWAERRALFTSDDAPGLFAAYRPSLTVLSRSVGGANAVTLSNYRLELPHERFLTARADDEKIFPLALALLLLSVVLHAPLIVRTARGTAGRFLRFRPRPPRPSRRGWWLLLTVPLLGAGLGGLMTLGSHPFDMASQKIWTYLLVNDSIGDLYYRAQTVPIAAIWNGMPFHEGVYPYGVGMSYFFYTVGWVHRLLGGEVAPDSAGLELSIKAANLLVAVADAGLLLALARGMGRQRFALLVPLAFLLNPAVLFDITIWGETESVALFFLLASLLAAQRSSARWAWTLLALAFLGKQTMALPAFLTGIYYLRLFPLRRTLEGIGVAMPVVIAAILPYLAAGYPPSIAIDPLLGSFRVFGGNEMEQAFQVVSFDTYNVWTLVTGWWHGAHGLARLQFPDSAGELGPFSYHQAGVVAFLAVVGALALWLLTSRRTGREPGLIFLVLAFAALAELVLPTRSIARYLIFPLVFALTASGRGTERTMWFVVGALTVTSLIGMYGSVASGLEQAPSLAPRLAPANNVVSAGALQIFRSDAAITVGALLNLAALLALAAALWTPRSVMSWARGWLPRMRRQPAPAPRVGEVG